MFERCVSPTFVFGVVPALVGDVIVQSSVRVVFVVVCSAFIAVCKGMVSAAIGHCCEFMFCLVVS